MNLRAARADSSWYPHSPGGRRYHIVRSDGSGSVCGLPMLVTDQPGPDGTGATEDPGNVPVVLRCAARLP